VRFIGVHSFAIWDVYLTFTLRSATIPLLDKPFIRTDFSKRDFRFSAPTVWNSLPQTILITDSLTGLKSRLKTFLFTQAFTEHWSDLPPAPLKLRPYGAIEIRLLLLLLLLLLCLVYSHVQFFSHSSQILSSHRFLSVGCCPWVYPCSKTGLLLQESLEVVSLCEVSFLRQGPRKEVCFKLPHNH